MATNENLKKIYTKTYVSFIILFFITLVVSFFHSFFTYKPETFHNQFFSSYLINATTLFFFKNLFFTSLLSIVICFSLIINREDTITSDGKKMFFYQIISRGLYILIFLTILYIFSTEYIVPRIENKLESLRNTTLRANTCLLTGNQNYKESNFVDCIKYYQEYLSIIEDTSVEDKLREVKNKINLPKVLNLTNFERIISSVNNEPDKDFIKLIYGVEINKLKYLSGNLSNDDKNKAWKILQSINFFEDRYYVEDQRKYADYDIMISDTVTDFSELAEIYYDKRDYITAWYYYQYVVETNSGKSAEARRKIELIRKALRLEKNINDDKEFDKFVKEREDEIGKLYRLKSLAVDYIQKNLYQKAYFTYTEILSLNSNLRDAIIGKNEALSQLTSIAVEYSEIQKAKKNIGKRNFVFLLSANSIINAEDIIKIYDINTLSTTYYLYNIKIYNYDGNFKIQSIINSKYGQMKSNNTGTLYCYDLSDKNIEYYPTITKFNSATNKETTETLYEDYFFKIPVDINILYNFSYDYNRVLNFSLVKLFQLKNLEQRYIIPESISKYEYQNVFLKKNISDKEIELFTSVYYFDEQSQNYKKRVDVKKSNLKKINELFINKMFVAAQSSIGFNNSFIKTAIADKISRIFLFFSVGILFLTIAWKMKSTYLGGIPFYHFPFFLLIPVFIYLFIKFIFGFITTLYSVLSSTLDFTLLLVITIIINVLFTVTVTLILSINKVE